MFPSITGQWVHRHWKLSKRVRENHKIWLETLIWFPQSGFLLFEDFWGVQQLNPNTQTNIRPIQRRVHCLHDWHAHLLKWNPFEPWFYRRRSWGNNRGWLEWLHWSFWDSLCLCCYFRRKVFFGTHLLGISDVSLHKYELRRQICCWSSILWKTRT